MPIINQTQTITLTAGGGTVSLPTTSPLDLYIITGTATLTSNWTIQPTGTALLGMVYNFRYQAEIDLDGNDITIFGKVLPTNLSDKTHVISCYYNGTSWEVDFLIDVTENGSLDSTMLNDYNSSDKEEILTIPISFETGRLVKQRIILPYSGNYDIHGFFISITKTIEATDDASVKFFNSSLSPMTFTTGSTFVIPAGYDSLDVVGGDDFTSNVSQTLPSHIFVETLKTTPGGEGLLYLVIYKQ